MSTIVSTNSIGSTKKRSKKVGEYLVTETLGEGTFGKVKLAKNIKTGELVAMKIIERAQAEQRKMRAQILREIFIMKRLKHKCVVELKEVLESRNNIYMVMELCTGGELFDKIVRAPEQRFSEAESRRYFQQLIDGVSYCHVNGVAHRDIKPENLLLDEDGNLKISDFGLANVMSGFKMSTACGTPNYVAPEVLSERPYDGRTADVWSCGVVLYVMLAGRLPFDEPTESALYAKIRKGDHQPYPSWFSPGVRALLDRILVPDPDRRITIEEIEKDPWFAVGYQKMTGIIAEHTEEKMAQVDEEEATEPAPDVSFHSGIDAFTLISMLDTLSVSPMLELRPAGTVKRRTCFITPAGLEKTMQVAERTAAEVRGVVQLDRDKFKIRLSTPRSAVTLQLYKVTEANTLVEVMRRKGDVFDFHKLYQFLSERVIAGCR